ncbi:MAG: hypothetical protein FJ161_02095 [Gammaproteobacteria bacterium]|nr:hypothetical protein [Gammaproteobacteria bacterium]
MLNSVITTLLGCLRDFINPNTFCSRSKFLEGFMIPASHAAESTKKQSIIIARKVQSLIKR